VPQRHYFVTKLLQQKETGRPGQLGPKRQFKPIDTLPFVSIRNTPIIGKSSQ
jgi:hypothetical protein